MQWEHKIIEGLFLKRYNRFFADVLLEKPAKTKVTAHVANTGSLKSCSDPESKCLVSHINDPNRKLQYSLEAIQAKSGSWVGVNTSRPNKLAIEIFNAKILKHWKDFPYIYSEVKISDDSRVDLILSKVEITDRKKLPDPKNLHLVEIKNVTLADGKTAMFPDAVTSRGLKHIHELQNWMSRGATAEFLFVIQRDDVEIFSAANKIDPDYSKALIEAHKQGLIVTPVSYKVCPDAGLQFHKQIAFHAQRN